MAKGDMCGGAGMGYSLFGQPQWMFPPGYNSKDATKRAARQFSDPHSDKVSPWAGVAAGTGTEKISDAQIQTRSAISKNDKYNVCILDKTRRQILHATPNALP